MGASESRAQASLKGGETQELSKDIRATKISQHILRDHVSRTMRIVPQWAAGKVSVSHGATGNVGREMMSVLAGAAPLPADEVVALASRRPASANREVLLWEQEDAEGEGARAFRLRRQPGYLRLMSAEGGAVSKEWSPKIGAQGVVVIDNSSAWRYVYDSDVPLIVPEVNADANVEGVPPSGRNIIANPNCSTAHARGGAEAAHDAATIKRCVVVATYQSVSGAGKDAMDELFEQTRAVFVAGQVKPGKTFPNQRIAFNVIPHIDVFMEDGSTKEEWKMMVETKKILDPKIKLHATCVRVPVFIGHSEAVNEGSERPITVEEAREVLVRGASAS